MASCPFCSAEVEDHLVVNGGSCPQCFGEIPGEETATDPGEPVRQAQAARDAAQVRGWRAPLVVVGLVVLLTPVGAGAYLLLQDEPEVVVMDLDDSVFDLGEFVVEPSEEPEDAPEQDQPIARGGAPATAPTPPLPQTNERGGNPAEVELSAEGAADPGRPRRRADRPEAPAGPAGLPRGPQEGGTADLGSADRGAGSGIRVRSRDDLSVQLTDEDEIRQMIVDVMGAQMRRLNYCYDQRLRQDQDLAGRWQLSFTVTERGRVDDAQAIGIDREDPELEDCVADMISEWTFQPISASQPVQRSITFRPG